MKERRKFFRFESPINIRYNGDKSYGEGLTKNISREGVAFCAPSKLTKEEMLIIEFEIPGDNIPLFAQGMVAWTKKERKGGKRKIYDIGIKLTNIEGADRSRILDYAYREWLKIKNIKRKV